MSWTNVALVLIALMVLAALLIMALLGLGREEIAFACHLITFFVLVLFSWYRVYSLSLDVRSALAQMAASRRVVGNQLEAWKRQGMPGGWHYYRDGDQVRREDLSGYIGDDRNPTFRIDGKIIEVYDKTSRDCPAARILDRVFRRGLEADFKKFLESAASSRDEGLPDWVITEPREAEHNVIREISGSREYYIDAHAAAILPNADGTLALSKGTALMPWDARSRLYQYALHRYMVWLAEQDAG